MLKKIIKSGVFLTLLVLYRVIAPFVKKSEIIVLMHHSVGSGDWQFTVTPESFKWQIDNLRARGFSFISADDLYKILQGQKPTPWRAVLLSFDDGYHDFVSDALPILKEFNLPSIVFIHADRSPKGLGNNLPLLSWDDIREMKKYRVEIGNHSNSHPDMKSLSADNLQAEINKTEEIFLRETSERPKFFAFPSGRYNQKVVDCLRDNKYALAFTINPWLVKKENDKLMLPRIGVIRNTNKIEFMARTTLANDWYQNLIGVLFGGKPKK